MLIKPVFGNSGSTVTPIQIRGRWGERMTSPEGHMAPDGSPVELFARLPAGSVPQLIHDAIPPGASILELGAGAGRITHPLIGLGHEVVAVDESPEMLAICSWSVPTVIRSPFARFVL